MADRKEYIKLEVKLIVRVDEGTPTSNVIDEMEYEFRDTTGNANIEDTEITDFEVEDSE